MSTELIIEGEMGKGGSAPTESKDNLISDQIVKTLFVVGEGEIQGVDGIYLDTVGIANFDATYEVRTGTVGQSVIAEFVDTETTLPGFTSKTLVRGSAKKAGEELPNVSAANSTNAGSFVINNYYKITTVGTTTNWKLIGASTSAGMYGEVFKATGVGSGNGVAIQQLRFEPNFYSTVIPYSATPAAAKLTFSISVMSRLDGDGNLLGSEVTIAIYTRPNGSSNWVLDKSITKKGKTTHGYTFDYTIKQPTGATSAAPWEIKIIRTSPDSASSKKQNTITWTTTTQVYYSNLAYNNPPSALIGVKLNDASQFGNKIPEIMFRVKGKKVKIPSNYDAASRLYTGNWDGSWKTTLGVVTKTYTNNPAWCLYDILTDTVAGLGIPEADIDKYSIYNLAKYADEQLPNGYSVPVVCQDDGEVLEESYPLFIPRFTLDYSFNTREGTKELLSQVLSLCNANLITNEFGQIAVIFQKPGQVVKRNISNANVIDGTFTYQSSNIEQRSNLVNVTYNNGLNFGRTDTVTVSDDSLITRYGLQPLDIVLPGCYYQAQAIRKARWALYTNCYFTNFVSFSVFLDGMGYKIGDLIKVYDNYNQDTQQAGTITGSSTASGSTTLTFDRAITLDTGNFTFSCFDSSGAEITKTITGGNTFSSIVIPNIVTVLANSIFIFSGTTVAGKIYRVTSISQNSDEQYAITGLEFDEAIFSYIDGTVNLTPKTGDFSGVGQFYTKAVESISVVENFATNGIYTTGKLQASWTWDTAKTQKYRANYKLTWSADNGITTIADNLTTDTYDIMNPTPGVYTITVWAINSFTGISSAAFSYQYSFRTASALSSLQPPVNVRVTGTSIASPQPTTLSFTTPALSLQFDYNPANQNVDDALYDYLVEVWNSTATTKISSYSVNPVIGTLTTDPIDSDLTYKPLNGLFELSFNENVNIFSGTPVRTFTVKIYSRDTLGDLSTPIAVSCTNPVPAFTSFTVSNDISKVRIDIAASTDIDVKEYYVWRGSTQLFTPNNDTNLLYKGPSNSITVNTPDNNSYYYKCAISDSFGNTNLNISDSKAGASIDMTVSRYSYVGLQFSTAESTNTVSWTFFTAYRETGTSEIISAGSAVWVSGTLYLYYVPGNATLQSTTDANTAVAGRILGSYKGGNDITADAGKAYIDGDQIIAGSLLANALSTSTAYITNMAMIGNIIQSDNYSGVSTVAATTTVIGRVYVIAVPGTTNFTLIGAANNLTGTVFTATGVGIGTGTVTTTNAGWRIDKTGAASFTGLTVQSATIDNNSNLGNKLVSTVLSDVATGVSKNKTFYASAAPTASSAGDLWYDTGTGTLKRWSGTAWDATSDATLSKLGGSGVNVMHPRYCTFEEASLPPIITSSGAGQGTWSLDSTTSAIGSKSLKLSKSVTSFNDFCALAPSPWGTYNQQLQPNKKWIFSIFMKSSVANFPVSIFVRYAGDTNAAAFTLTTGLANTWARYSYVLDFSTLNVKDFLVILDPQEFAVADLWFDGLMIEEQIGTLTTPSAYAESPNFLTTFIGDLEATKNRVYRQTTAPTGTSYSTGDLWFNTSTNGDFYQWNGSSWAVVATIGADSSNLKSGISRNLFQNPIATTAIGFNTYQAPNYTIVGPSVVTAGNAGTPLLYNSIKFLLNGAGSTGNYTSSLHNAGTALSIPVVPGQRLEAQAYVQLIDGGVRLELNFLDSAGNGLGPFTGVTGGLTTRTTDTFIDNNLSSFVRLWGFATAPANAVKAYIELRCYVNNGKSSMALYSSMFYLGYASAGQTEASLWTLGAPSNTNQLADGALLGQTALWSGIPAGTGKAEDYATVGANSSNLKVGLSGNLFPNGDLSGGIANWVVNWVQGTGTNYTVAWDLAGPDWVPAKGHCIGVVRSGTLLAASGAFDLRYTKAIPVQQSKRYELTGYLANHRCYASIFVGWFKLVSGVETNISYSFFDSPTLNNGGQSLNNWYRAGGFATAPADATYAYIHVRAGSQFGGDPYMWATNIYFGEALANQTELSPYSNSSSSFWNEVTGTGKPADNATANNITKSATEPTTSVNGDIWVDTSLTPNVTKVRVGGAWQSAATNTTNTNQLTDGAGLGSSAVWTSVSSRPTSLATLNATDGTNLSTAITNASTASSNASTALTAVNDIASDSKLTPVEKSSVRAEWNCIEAEKPVFVTQATAYAVSSTAYTTAFTALGDYLNGSKATAWTTGTPDWITDTNLASTTDIAGGTFRTKFKDYYDARVALSNLINGAIKTIADGAASTASTASSNASSAVTAANGKNKTYTAATAPTTGVVAGDLWYDTTVGIMKRYTSGAWVSTVYNSKNMSGAGAPSGAANVGDTYFDTTTKLMYTYGSSTDIAATLIATGGTYTIKTAGTTNFTTVGATSNTVGEIFKATGTPTGTGTVSGFTWQKVMPLMTSSNISNFIDSASIGSAQIGTAQVGTLKIAGNAVTVNEVILTSAVTANKPANSALAQADTYLLNGQAITGVDVATKRIITLSVELAHYSNSDSYFGVCRVGTFPIFFTPPSNLVGSLGNVNQYTTSIVANLEAENAVVSAGNFIPGNVYIIESVGTTNFSACGAAYPVVSNVNGVTGMYNSVGNSVGSKFIAVSAGSGTGTAKAVADIGCIKIVLINGAANTVYWNATAPTVRLRGVIMTGKR
jgi:predicted phage tail protein